MFSVALPITFLKTSVSQDCITSIIFYVKAQEKFAPRCLDKGKISPKIVRSLMNEGSFIDDKVAIDYFAGVLASSRTPTGVDDHGLSMMIRLMDQLSQYQLRSHYLIYGTIKQKFVIICFLMMIVNKWSYLSPTFYYAKAMRMTKKEYAQIDNLMHHSMQGLITHGLIDKDFQFGYPDHHPYFKGFEFDGFLCKPTLAGAQFFLWAFGAGDGNVEYLFHKNFKPKIHGIPPQILYTLFT